MRWKRVWCQTCVCYHTTRVSSRKTPPLPVELPQGQVRFIVLDQSKEPGHRLVSPATRARARVARTRVRDN